MVEAGRGCPVAPGVGTQAQQETRRVVGVGRRVERFVEVAERLGMGLQVHLHAADIDLPHAARQGEPGPDHGGRLAVEIHRGPIGVDRPGPGLQARQRRHRPAAFGLGNGGQQARRGAVLFFRAAYGRAALRALRVRPTGGGRRVPLSRASRQAFRRQARRHRDPHDPRSHHGPGLPHKPPRSIGRPKARPRDLQRVPVGIAEI